MEKHQNVYQSNKTGYPDGLSTSYIWGQKPSWPIRNRNRPPNFFKNCHGYKRLGNTFWVCFFHFWYSQNDFLRLKAKIRWYIKKCEIQLFEKIWQVSHILLKKSFKSWNMTEPSSKSSRVDPVDGFQSLSWYHIMSRSHFGFFGKKVSFSLFYAIFLKEYFKPLFKQLVFEKFQFFFDIWLRSIWRL